MNLYSRLRKKISILKSKKRKNLDFTIPRQFRQDKVIFVHIPKCAGSAFLDSYLGYQLGHTKASQYYQLDADFFCKSFVFSFVRNPIDRFVSAYNFLQSNTLWSYVPGIKEHLSLYGSDIEEFASNLLETSEILNMPWFEPQYKYLEINGKVAMNKVFKTETFSDDLKILEKETGILLRSLAEINRSSLPRKNYKELLSSSNIKKLEMIYEKDFTLFGYF